MNAVRKFFLVVPLVLGVLSCGGSVPKEQGLEQALEMIGASVMSPVPFHQELHAKYLEDAKRGNIEVLFIGDSITYAWEKKGQGLELWEEYYRPLGALHFGIPGDQVQYMRARLADGELEGFAAKVIVVMAGTNNLKSGPTRMPAEAVATGSKRRSSKPICGLRSWAGTTRSPGWI